jgi:hypothetical protein
LGRSPVAVTLGGGMGLLGLAQGRTLEMALRHEMGPRPTDAPCRADAHRPHDQKVLMCLGQDIGINAWVCAGGTGEPLGAYV